MSQTSFTKGVEIDKIFIEFYVPFNRVGNDVIMSSEHINDRAKS